MGEDSEASEWEYGIEDVGEEAAEGNGEGETSLQASIKPQSLSGENVAFVLLGVLLAVAIVLVSIGIVP
jgi:hypothetical protein